MNKTVKITIKTPFWFRLWMSISFLFTGVFEEEIEYNREKLLQVFARLRP